VRAQPAGKLPTIGFLGSDASAFSPWTAAFVARLRELGGEFREQQEKMTPLGRIATPEDIALAARF